MYFFPKKKGQYIFVVQAWAKPAANVSLLELKNVFPELPFNALPLGPERRNLSQSFRDYFGNIFLRYHEAKEKKGCTMKRCLTACTPAHSEGLRPPPARGSASAGEEDHRGALTRYLSQQQRGVGVDGSEVAGRRGAVSQGPFLKHGRAISITSSRHGETNKNSLDYVPYF